MGLSGFLNNLALTLESIIGFKLAEGEYRLGMLNLEPVTEVQPLNRTYEAILLRCKKCGKSTAFLSLGRIDHYIDVEKKSKLQCRHCQFETQVPKIQEIRATQGKTDDFLQLQEKHFTKIISKKGKLTHFSARERKLQFEYTERGVKKRLDIDIPQNKLPFIQKIQVQQPCRIKIKLFETALLDPRRALQTTLDSSSEPLVVHNYELLNISKLKKGD